MIVCGPETLPVGLLVAFSQKIPQKLGANSKKVTMPGSSGQRNTLSHRNRSVMKVSSQGQLLRVGVASMRAACSVGGGRGPTSWWCGYAFNLLECVRPVNRAGCCSSCSLRAVRIPTYAVCKEIRNDNDASFSGAGKISRGGARPHSFRQGRQLGSAGSSCKSVCVYVCLCVSVGKNNIKEGDPHGSRAPVVT